jgi:hypothetical protein
MPLETSHFCRFTDYRLLFTAYLHRVLAFNACELPYLTLPISASFVARIYDRPIPRGASGYDSDGKADRLRFIRDFRD